MSEVPQPTAADQIADTATLLRRFMYQHVTDDGLGGLRIQSDAFLPQSGEDDISVYVEEVLESLGLTMEATLDGHEGFGLTAFPVSLARAAGLEVRMAPDPTDGLRGQAHASVQGRLRSRSPRKALSRGSEVRVWPAHP
jgi:hypothetical protein